MCLLLGILNSFLAINLFWSIIILKDFQWYRSQYLPKYLFRLLETHNTFSSPFSASRVRDFGIVNRYPWFWQSFNMANWRNEFCFFRGIHVRVDARTDISISIRPMTTNVGNQVHLEDLTQKRLTKQVLVMLLRQTPLQIKNISSIPNILWPSNLAR